jgi:hypothetical protein
MVAICCVDSREASVAKALCTRGSCVGAKAPTSYRNPSGGLPMAARHGADTCRGKLRVQG